MKATAFVHALATARNRVVRYADECHPDQAWRDPKPQKNKKNTESNSMLDLIRGLYDRACACKVLHCAVSQIILLLKSRVSSGKTGARPAMKK